MPRLTQAAPRQDQPKSSRDAQALRGSRRLNASEVAGVSSRRLRAAIGLGGPRPVRTVPGSTLGGWTWGSALRGIGHCHRRGQVCGQTRRVGRQGCLRDR